MFKKMCVLYVNGEPHSRHVIPGIRYGEKDFYRATTSMNAFSERENERFYNAYIKGKKPEKRTSVHNYDEWIRDRESMSRSLEESGIDDFVDPVEQTPVFEHNNIKDFYEAIGYDLKKKKYHPLNSTIEK